ncbi:hypothetical protein [Paenibacillus montanisoli]|uniref:Uncharacterized protein n=1 Tax=Paenibacillus montanisoli TaxID=2081970 RepID=A0A328TZ60_9BACL|nr:hypothetical protein [Paenibacillus montanisoli]RAP75690.1 hypothetical protein DL346_09540 [Paenibacillus montanisoli]
MLQAVDVNLDAGEMVLKLEKESAPKTIEYSKLERLEVGKEPVRKLLWTVEVKVIKVHVRGSEDAFVISSNKVGDYDNIEQHLLKIAEKYEIAVEQ